MWWLAKVASGRVAATKTGRWRRAGSIGMKWAVDNQPTFEESAQDNWNDCVLCFNRRLPLKYIMAHGRAPTPGFPLDLRRMICICSESDCTSNSF